MKPASRMLLLGAIVGALAGCGKDKSVGPKPSEITGTWQATKVEYVKKADTSVRVDLIAAGGAATCALGTDHSYTFIVTPSGGSPDTTTGTWAVHGDLFEVTPTGMPYSWMWEVSLSGNRLMLTGADVEFDFDHDGMGEEAKNNTVLVR